MENITLERLGRIVEIYKNKIDMGLQEYESQSVETSHIYSKQVLEQQGYEVELDLTKEVKNE